MPIDDELDQILLRLGQLEAVEPATRVELCTQGLSLLLGEDLPELRAQIHVELGAALIELPSGDRAKNIDRAITALGQSLEIMNQNVASPLERGRAMSLLAEAWTKRPSGGLHENLQRAIEIYGTMLSLLRPDEYRLQWADTMRRLGDAHFEMSQSGTSRSNELAIRAYEQALPAIPSAEYPDAAFAVRYNLASAYMWRQDGSRAENLDRAVVICENGLGEIPQDNHPKGWAGLHALLGAILLQRTHRDRAEDIQRAITHLQMALYVVKRETMPDQWATIMQNLGLAFSSRPILDPVRNQEAAIRAYTDALEIHTRKATPIEWALNMSGLATAYMRLSAFGAADLSQKGIATYKEALTTLTPRDTPADWGRTQANLGDAYLYLGRRNGERAFNLDSAIEAYSQALQTITKERDPKGWAQVQQRLGTAHAAHIQEGKTESRHKAVTHYENALTVRSLEGMPREHRETQKSLGDLFFEEGAWLKAYAAYSSAIEATDLLYDSAGIAQARLAELGEVRDLPTRSAYCLAKLGRVAEAVEVLEDGRAHALIEALSLVNTADDAIAESDREAFSSARARIVDAEIKSRQGSKTYVTPITEFLGLAEEDVSKLPTTGRDFLHASTAIRQARTDLENISGRIRAYHPDFMPEGWRIAEINDVAAALSRPLVYLLATQHGSLAIIVVPKSLTFENNQMVWLDRCDTGELNRLLFSADNDRQYIYSNVPGMPIETLQAKLDEVWGCLRAELVGPLEGRLVQMGYHRAILIPMGLLGIAPLPAAAELIQFSIAPSARVTQTIHNKIGATARIPARLFGIANPLPSPEPLPFAQQEVCMIRRHFPRKAAAMIQGESATRAAALQGMVGATHIHFACHGTFNVARPLDSVLSLARPQELTLRDILDAGLDFSSARLVVLSACRTGIIDYKTVADEVVGFAAAFLQKGIPGVVASLWPVPDLPTALLLNKFYEFHTGEGLEPADALHRSQRWLRNITAKSIIAEFEAEIRRPVRERCLSAEQATQICDDFSQMEPGEMPFAHPFCWAAFIVSGS